MFSEPGVFKDSLAECKPVLFKTGSPYCSDYFVFDLGTGIDYDYQINVRIFEPQMDNERWTFGILFNQTMSLDLYCVMTSDINYETVCKQMFAGKEKFANNSMCGMPFHHTQDDPLFVYLKKNIKDFSATCENFYIFYYVNYKPTDMLKNVYYVHK